MTISGHRSAFGSELKVRVDIVTKNPLNGSQGRSKGGMLMRSEARRKQRWQTANQCLYQLVPVKAQLDTLLAGDIEVVVTRVAPRQLDQHDGLGAALKGSIDGVCDFIAKKDNDKSITWVLQQRKGRVKEYAVEILIRRRGT